MRWRWLVLLGGYKEHQSSLWVLSAPDSCFCPEHRAPPPRPAQCGSPTRNPPLLQFEIRQLRAHLAQQDLDLTAEREAALRAPQVLRRPRSRYHVVEEAANEGFVEELQPSPGKPPAASSSPVVGRPSPL